MHGDFDWPGLRIANHVMQLVPARPWRFTARDYTPTAGRPLDGPPVSATWDPNLAPKMKSLGLAVDEEALADGLLEDLRDA